MPEYRRFIAYFYEYIDGRKQNNAGFVRVELRNEVWRLLLRLNAGIRAEPPVQVYGFVRAEGYLLELPLGTIRPGQEQAGEWAFRDDAPVGKDDYGLRDLAGLWIESSDGRRFGTVWDDEGIDPGRMVTELPGKTPDIPVLPELPGRAPDVPVLSELPGRAPDVPIPPEQTGERVPDPRGISESGDAEEQKKPESPEEKDTELPGETVREARQELSEQAVQEGGEELPGTRAREDIRNLPEQEELPGPREKEARKQECGIVEELFRKRTPFRPFSDAEIENCVMLMPCDVVRLQQDGWQVGRSSFLQHGFYQYRHLLLGVDRSGAYVLGVPGVRNPQEAYMARMFGFDRFKGSKSGACSRDFGYWCRELRRNGQALRMQNGSRVPE